MWSRVLLAAGCATVFADEFTLTATPTANWSLLPTRPPTILPTPMPTTVPTTEPSPSPHLLQTEPSVEPTTRPSFRPTTGPSSEPTTTAPSLEPTTVAPSLAPTTTAPSLEPTQNATPTFTPTSSPLAATFLPTPLTGMPTSPPSLGPTMVGPSLSPTTMPPTTSRPTTSNPTSQPTLSPTTSRPTTPNPSSLPTLPPTTSAPSSVPSGAPTISPIPTAQPSSSPSAYPTSVPTAEPRLTLLPGNVTLNLTKPATGTETLYFINLSDRDLQQCLVLNQDKNQGSTVPNYSITLETGQVVAATGSEPTPITISKRVGANSQLAQIKVWSADLPRSAGGSPYELEFFAVDAEGSTSCLSNAIEYSQANSVSIRVHVETTADPGQTTLRSRSDVRAILGERYDGLEIFARDIAGDTVVWESLESFAIDISFRGLRASCNVQLPDMNSSSYPVTCTMPDVVNAGEWQVDFQVKNMEGSVDSKTIDVVCPKGTYRSLEDKTCRVCAEEMICDFSGLSLDTVGIERGHWRASDKTTVIYDCETKGACVSAEPIRNEAIPGAASYKAWGNYLCDHERSRGVLCQVCTGFSRYDVIKHRCVKCGSRLRFALVFCGFCIVMASVAILVVWLAKKMGAANDLSEFVKETVRYGSGDGTIRVLRRKTRSSYSEQQSLDASERSSDDQDAKRKRAALLQRLKVSMLNKCKILIA